MCQIHKESHKINNFSLDGSSFNLGTQMEKILQMVKIKVLSL